MRVHRLAALLLLAAGVAVPATPATAAPISGPDGLKCGWIATTDPNPEAEAYRPSGWVFTALVVTEPGGFSSGTARCTFRTQTSHTGPVHAERSAPTDSNGLIVLAQTVTVVDPTPWGFEMFLCTSFEYDSGELYYWDGTAKQWSTSDAVPCNPIEKTDTGAPRPHEAAQAACPYFGQVPFVGNTLKNLYNCIPGAPAPTNVYAYTVQPDL